MMELCDNMDVVGYRRPWASVRPKRRTSANKTALLLALFASSATRVVAQDCIPLTGSTACPAFSDASVSTSSDLAALYPFLAFVSNLEEFDQQLSDYVMNGYVRQKYQDTLGCDNVDLSNTSALYARYTTSFLCNGIVQISRRPCGTSATAAPPLCADSCAELAISEQKVTSNDQLCGNPIDNYVDLIRADFTNCALPAESLSEACVAGAKNEPDNCGFGPSLAGLCDYCRASSENATDSCCIGSNAVDRCENVVLPQFSVNPTLLPTSTANPTSSATNTPSVASDSGRLSAGAIAGIAIGSIVAAVLIITLLTLCFFFIVRRRRDRSRSDSIFNQPTPQQRSAANMQQARPPSSQDGYEVLPGGRVTRMSALQGPSAGSRAGSHAGATGLVGRPGSRRDQDTSDSDVYGDSPSSENKVRGPRASKRGGSLSSNSVLPVGQDSSPNSDSNGQYSSPEGVNSGQSEQLGSFKDYYSSDEIHPNDKVSVLWAYQPRAGDEFELERGDMLRVVGIWDDGWATGIRIDDRAEDYDGKHQVQRDSGVSNGSGGRAQSPPPTGEIKAFPLVCVCLPEAWRKTVDGETSTESGSGAPPGS